MKAKILVLAVVLMFLLPAGSVCCKAPTNNDLSEALATNEQGEEVTHGVAHEFPPSLASYDDAHLESIPQILQHRIRKEPFNLIATIIFLLAVIHTFMASKLMTISHRRQQRHAERISSGEADERSVDLGAEVLHFFGEVEVVFGIWLIPLIVAITSFHGWSSNVHYIHDGVNLTEAAFVVVIMVLASTRPILRLAEAMMSGVAKLFGGSLKALWFTIMTLGPLLGSFITEPAAMTICALLLSHKFYALGPSAKFKYATLALLFVNVSVGGVLTNFAAPPVLMVAGTWQWSTIFMLSHFGWKVIIGILISTTLYFWMFRKEFATMERAYTIRDLKDQIVRKYLTQTATEAAWKDAAQQGQERENLLDTMRNTTENFLETIRERMKSGEVPELEELGYDKELIKEAADERFEEARLYRTRRFLPLLLPEKDRAEFLDPDWDNRDDPVPAWITLVHLLFMGWTIVNAHYPELFIIGFLFFLGFAQVTTQYQNRINLRPAMLVGFFLASLVIHAGLQAWWIAPVLGNLKEGMLMVGATVLTAFNDNAAITYLSTLVPGFTDSLKYAVVAGAIAGGGLTVIANAPNPAGQSLLKKHFDGAVSPKGLLLGALVPTVILWLCLALL
jgi:hypothetical protein